MPIHSNAALIEKSRPRPHLVGLPVGEAETPAVCREGDDLYADYAETYQRPEPEPAAPKRRPNAREYREAIQGIKKEGKPVTTSDVDKRASALVGTLPSLLTPKFHLLTLLKGPKLHLGDDKAAIATITCHKFPSDQVIVIDTIRNQTPERPAPSRNAAINHCINGMLGAFHGLPELRFLEEQKRRFSVGHRYIDRKKLRTAKFVTHTFKRFPLSVPGSDPMQVNVAMPKETGNQIIERSNSLGIDKPDIIILCCCKALSTQPDCNPQDRLDAEGIWLTFMDNIRLVGKWHYDACNMLGMPELPAMEEPCTF